MNIRLVGNCLTAEDLVGTLLCPRTPHGGTRNTPINGGRAAPASSVVAYTMV
jgi:hypothetical protein